MTDRTSHLRSLPLDDAALDAATAHYAGKREDDALALSSAFVFRLGSEWLAVPTSLLDRVADVTPVHSLPHRRSGTVAGLVNVGGELVVHVSLSSLLGLENETQARSRAVRRLVVLADSAGRLAITVDEVWAVHHYDPATCRAAPATLARAAGTYTTSMLDVAEHTVGILDAARVMSALSVAIS